MKKKELNDLLEGIKVDQDLLDKHGLELRVEPSFRYGFDSKDKGSVMNVSRQNDDFGNSLDISLYKNDKLCLPKYTSCNLGDIEINVDRSIKGDIIPIILEGIAKQLTFEFNKDLKRIYEILDVDSSSFKFDFENNNYIRITDSTCTEDVLYLISNRKVDPNIIDEFWSRNYPIDKPMLDGSFNQMIPDRSLGNSFSIYLVDPRVFERKNKFRIACYESNRGWHDNKELVNLSNSSIMSLDYGYRMRVVDSNKSDEVKFEEVLKKLQRFTYIQ